MKSRHSAVSGSSTAAPASGGPTLGSPGAGAGNAAAQEALKKRMGGGQWTVASGDTLSRIAVRRYGNAAFWGDIRDANPDRVKDGGHLIYVGTILDIPEIDLPEIDVPEPAGASTAGASAGASSASAGATAGAAASVGAAVVEPGGECPAKEPVSRVTEFGSFEIWPDDYEGPLPESGEGVQRVHQWRFAEIEAESATEAVDADIAALDGEQSFAEPVVVCIAGEQVRVSSKAEAQHTAQMFQEIREVYGIRIDSQIGVDAVKARYTQVPAAELEKLRTKEWEYKEVVGLYRALEHYAPILGANREASSEAGIGPGVTSVSKVHQSIDENKQAGKVDTKTMGEYFGSSTNVSFFTAGTDSRADFADNQTQLEATAIHELAHGLMAREVPGYAAATGYWADISQPVEDTTLAEQPMTKYGRTNASEDLSEATMFYFTEPETLSATCPLRHAYIDRVVSSWSTSPSGAP